MGFAFLELIQQDDGEVILREGDSTGEDEAAVHSGEADTARASGTKDPLLRIKFSQAILDMLDADAISLAEVMIEAATRALAEQNDDGLEAETDDETTIRLQTSVLH